MFWTPAELMRLAILWSGEIVGGINGLSIPHLRDIANSRLSRRFHLGQPILHLKLSRKSQS